jgi:hypothetical protein
LKLATSGPLSGTVYVEKAKETKIIVYSLGLDSHPERSGEENNVQA